MIIQSFTLEVNNKKSYGYPIGEGLIFATNDLSHVSDLSQWNKMTCQEYMQWK
jgi:hypothetical protein